MDPNPPNPSFKDHVTSKQSRDNIKVPIRLKKSTSTGLFRLFTKGASNNPKQDLQTVCKASIEPSVTAGLRDIGLEVVPCNFIRPSGLKLEPRSELETRRAPTNSEFSLSPRRGTPRKTISEDSHPNRMTTLNECDLPRPNQAKATFQSRATKARILIKDIDESHGNHDNYLSIRSPIMSPVSPVHETGLPAFASLRLQFVVGRIAMNFESSAQWTSWLKSYSKGQFNVNNPPEHPRLSLTFTHLPAVYPEDEEKRILSSREFESVSQEWIKRRAQLHLNSAMKRFGTRYGAVSFFDDDYEIFQAENGYNVTNVQRSSSIAAHTLYTTETLSIVDAEQDWRFRDNPMVTGKPHIRFFAATPLLGTNGKAIGVLSIFSRERRHSFDYDERLKLAKCGAALATELRTQLKSVQDSQPMTPAYKVSVQNSLPPITSIVMKVSPPRRDPTMKDIHFSRNPINMEKKIGQEASSSSAIKYPVFGSLVQPLDQLFTRQNSGISHMPAEHTPPSSVESSQGPSFADENDLTTRSQRSFAARPSADSVTLSCRTSSTSEADSSRTSKTHYDCKTVIESVLREGSKDGENIGCDTPHSHSSLQSPSPPPKTLLINSGLRDVESTSFDLRCLHEPELRSSKEPYSSNDFTVPDPSLSSYPNPHSNKQLQFLHPNLDITVEDFLSLPDGDLLEDSEETILSENFTSNVSEVLKIGPRDEDFSREQINGIKHDLECKFDPRDINPQNLDPSFNLRLQAKSKMPKSFLSWKFPKTEDRNPSEDASISKDTIPRSDNMNHSSMSSGTSSSFISETIQNDQKDDFFKEASPKQREPSTNDVLEALSSFRSNESLGAPQAGDFPDSSNTNQTSISNTRL
ncbi:putative gaf domain-containing protein [Golovinomyces cichoracearum]|uniref:Putative gaf domain-containing protein n=1 Tax=Golovinomyces cichoracearum TaxID=62708 RepID=A0A420HH71_9PEZI|nr:putative gaf domain-containing protein [Golovinomyces cichoracearum]